MSAVAAASVSRACLCTAARGGVSMWLGVMLTSAFASTSAPFASSAPTTSAWPLEQAAYSGAHPFCSAHKHRRQHLPPPSSRRPPYRSHPLAASVTAGASHGVADSTRGAITSGTTCSIHSEIYLTSECETPLGLIMLADHPEIQAGVGHGSKDQILRVVVAIATVRCHLTWCDSSRQRVQVR
jgi:hypothetical protein